ncbi:response regulator transcription factor [Caenimonas terrae]|uniref:Response regulator transcription factor n=1 Tax=Caenimonas terrae TaxID=696074 RepID=A0ABW0NBH9_9BURK
MTSLSPNELEFLVRVDGSLSLAQIQAGMPAVTQDAFASLFRGLRDRRLLEPTQADPLALQLQACLNQMALPVSDAKADSGVSSLRSSGFYVEIARERSLARPPGGVLTAIVVEDEPTLARFIQSYLAFEGFQVRLASNRSEIVAEFSKPPVPDLILLDVLLPDADGFDILSRVRQHKALSQVPVVMLTGKATREAVLKGMAGGADGYVTKPFEAESLLRVVRAVVGLPAPPEQAPDPWASRDAGSWKL